MPAVLKDVRPADLVARAEEKVVAIGAEADSAKFRPDIAVKKPWEETGAGGVAVAGRGRAPEATLPTRVFVDDEVERWIEIHDEAGQLVTVIELLSPSNKEDEPARGRYCNQRRTFI